MEVKIRCLTPVKMTEIKSLKPDIRNPNTHPPGQVELLAKAIKYQGWRDPVIVSNRTKTMISGEGRLMAARLLEMEKVPVSFQDYENEEMEILDIMAQNELDKKAILDVAKTKDLLLEVDTGNIDLELSGFTMAEIEKQMTATKLDEVEEDKFNIEADRGITLLAEGELTVHKDWDTGIYKAYTDNCPGIAQALEPYNGKNIKLYITVIDID